MEKTHHQFVATGLGGGAVSKDGKEFTLEFETAADRLWVTLPAEVLERLTEITSELRALSIDARNGVARRWHIEGDPDRKRGS